MELAFEEYRAGKIVNVHRHVDSWFWDKYTAMPYVGCRSGCDFCYLRGSRYLGRRDPNTFDTFIRVKANAAELLRKELSRLESDVIACGDWQQPAEDHYQLSRKMLTVIHDLSFPLLVIERSPLLLRDLDLLVEINRRAWTGVIFSMSNVDRRLKQAFEPRSPGLKRRLLAMEQLATAGILVGTALMPILPLVGDDRTHLEEVVQATKDHGGSFVLGGSLTMDGVQAERTLDAVRKFEPALEARWRQLYDWKEGTEPQYGPPQSYSARIGSLVRDVCQRHGLKDRMPRYIPSGPLAVNKRLAEGLFLKTYELELNRAKGHRVWAYRKAAWTVDEYPQSIAALYAAQGEGGLTALPNIGKSLGKQIARWLNKYQQEQAASREGDGNENLYQRRQSDKAVS